MQPKFTQRNLWSFCMKVFALAVILVTVTRSSYSQVQLFNEGFAVVAPLPAGWAQQNLSAPPGTTPNWIQGVPAIFPSHTGAPNEYILCTFNSVDGANIISNWLFAPTVTLTNGDTFSFWTRTVDAPAFPDRLQVRMSTNGASVNVGATNISVGDFTTLLLDINPTLTTAGYPNVWTLQTITISGLAAPVSGRIAFRYFVDDGGPLGNNSDNIGIDDVIYFQTVTPACTGTPAPGNTISSDTTSCAGTPFSLSVANATPGSGVTYQWQSSSTLAGPYTNIPGATSSTYTATLTATTFYQLVVTCAGTPGTSTPVQVLLTPAAACYCTSTATNPADEDIVNVTIGTLNNSSTCASLAPGFGSAVNLYSNYTSGTGAPAPGDIVSGGTNPFSVSVGTCGGNFTSKVAIWIDYDRSGSFDAAEKVYVSPIGFPAGPHTETGNIFIPASAQNGITRMRVVNVETANAAGIQPCGTYTWGETEDYLVNITPCTGVTITGQPESVTTSCGGNAIFTAATAGDNPSFRWEYRTGPTGPWLFVVNDATFSGASNDTLTITSATESLDGYEFRAVYTGSCTATDFTDSATLTVTQLEATVNPSSATICNGGAPQLLSITNSAAAPTTITVASGPLTLAVPDNIADGVSTTLAVAGVPATAVVSGISVKFNMTHTYCGDMIINLKAPNGNILNLDKYLTGTASAAGPLPNIGFVNTIISSAGTVALGTVATQPITGTFRADAINGTIPFVVQDPTGFPSNAPNFAALFSVPNGTWTLAMADGGPADLGVLTSWSIDVTYVSPVLATGVWSPATGLYNDLALTSPYDGVTPVSTVYAAPTVSTDYTVIVSTASCTSTPAIIPITVADTISSVTQPADTIVCRGSSITFTADANTGGPLSYQWQVSSDGGTTWTDVVDGGAYSGATTNTLTLTDVPASFDNNQYRLVISVAACSNTATSDAATLTVSDNPTVAISVAPFTSLYPGLTTVLSAVLTPASATSTFQWFLNGDTIPGATASTYEAGIDGLGNYSVIATNASGCSASSTDDITITDSLNTNLFIYPNPSTGLFQVRYNNQLNGVSPARVVAAYDSKGARVYNKQFIINSAFGRMDVDMRNYPKGIYVIELTDGSGNRLGAERIVIF